MKIRLTQVVALALAAGPAALSASELGRLDNAAPGAMISTCGGMNWSGSAYAIGDKGVWLPGLFNCNATQTSAPTTGVGASASYVVGGTAPVDAFASGQTLMGEMHLYAHSLAVPAAGFAQAEATGGWADMLTVTPVNPADIGKTASLNFAIHVEGTLAGQGATDSFNSGAGFGLKPYVNDASLTPGPGSEFAVGGQGQWGFPYNQSVDQLAVFTAEITLGSSFELGVYARAIAGNASSGDVYVFNDATVDFTNTITWAGISSVTVDGVPLAYTLASASGIDWTQAYTAAVPEPTTWALWVAGLLGVRLLRPRQERKAT